MARFQDTGGSPRPILLTGVPRSGTTWLARLLASAPGTALAGREPMNPRGRQYALAGTVTGWVRLTKPNRKQVRALRSSYRGYNPWVYSRYGQHQWKGPLPGTRMIVKDPFALLSLPAVVSVTGALPVLVFRHPAAVLASYRRMGWRPDLGEIRPLVDAARGRGVDALPQLPPADASDAEQMGAFWSALHLMALGDAAEAGDIVVVSHQELAAGGLEAGRVLAERLGLRWHAAMEAELSRDDEGSGVDEGRLHNFARSPADVAAAWRRSVSDEEVAEIEAVSATAREGLDAQRLHF